MQLRFAFLPAAEMSGLKKCGLSECVYFHNDGDDFIATWRPKE